MKHLFKRSLISFVLLISAIGISRAQDPRLQFYQYRTYLNLAATGSEKGLNVAMIYKNQWNYMFPVGFSPYVLPQTYNLQRHRLGGNFAYRDVEAKTLQTNYVGASYAYVVKISKNVNLHIGINGAFVNKSLDKAVLSLQIN